MPEEKKKQPKKEENIEEKPDPEMDNYVHKILNAIIKGIEGDDQTGKYDYLTKPDHNNIKTLSVLSESQLDSTAECCFLGQSFPSMSPLANFVKGLAEWSPSKQGKRAEQLTATMIHTETSVIPTVIQQASNSKKDKKKEEKEGEK